MSSTCQTLSEALVYCDRAYGMYHKGMIMRCTSGSHRLAGEQLQTDFRLRYDLTRRLDVAPCRWLDAGRFLPDGIFRIWRPQVFSEGTR